MRSSFFVILIKYKSDTIFFHHAINREKNQNNKGEKFNVSRTRVTIFLFLPSTFRIMI